MICVGGCFVCVCCLWVFFVSVVCKCVCVLFLLFLVGYFEFVRVGSFSRWVSVLCFSCSVWTYTAKCGQASGGSPQAHVNIHKLAWTLHKLAGNSHRLA